MKTANVTSGIQMTERSRDPIADQADRFLADSGIMIPIKALHHRDEEYSERVLDILRTMQRDHFWYRGRHRFVHQALNDTLARLQASPDAIRFLDVGGGCGGWIEYLEHRAKAGFLELALADSSLRALMSARAVVGPTVQLYQADIMDLGWQERWDVVTVLDVLEHLPDDAGALRQVAQALTPNGIVFVTTPALKTFWSYNDVLVRHRRRYSLRDMQALAGATELELLDVRYFMFFLSPLILLRKIRRLDSEAGDPTVQRQILERTHTVPPRIVNQFAEAVFRLETPLGHRVRFPWGSSLLAIFRKT